jgi:metallophosphoesterase (TIGR00282 family)
VRLLFVGDVVGSPGRRTLAAVLPQLRERHELDWVVVNGENAAGGLGITEKIAREFLDGLGVDVVTLGNHAFRHRDVYPFLDRDARIIRPANYFRADPGRGHTVIEKDGKRLAVINLSGTVFVEAARSPFAEVDAILSELRGKYDHVLVDFHAEATSEKVAMGWYLDGRVLGCFGTHTHVPTADLRVLPGGTAYITDAGMTGSRAGVIGMDRELAVKRFTTMSPVKLESATGDPWLNGVIVEAGDDGLAIGVEQVLEPLPS